MMLPTRTPPFNLPGYHQALVQYTPYLCRLLRRRRVAAPQVAAALPIVGQCLAVLWLEQGPPRDRTALRRLLDRAVYLATKELGRATRPLMETAVQAPAVRDGALVKVLRQLDALPTAERLLWRLKQAWYYYPALPDQVNWEPDEAAYLAALHPEQTLAQVTAQFLSWLSRRADKRRGVPAEVIAWLLRRKTANAVDQAYRTLCRSLRRVLLWEEEETTATGPGRSVERTTRSFCLEGPCRWKLD